MVAAAGQAATKLRHRTPEERRRGAGGTTRVRSPRHNSWEVYQEQNGSGRYRRLGSGVKWNSQGLIPPKNILRS